MADRVVVGAGGGHEILTIAGDVITLAGVSGNGLTLRSAGDWVNNLTRGNSVQISDPVTRNAADRNKITAIPVSGAAAAGWIAGDKVVLKGDNGTTNYATLTLGLAALLTGELMQVSTMDAKGSRVHYSTSVRGIELTQGTHENCTVETDVVGQPNIIVGSGMGSNKWIIDHRCSGAIITDWDVYGHAGAVSPILMYGTDAGARRLSRIRVMIGSREPAAGTGGRGIYMAGTHADLVHVVSNCIVQFMGSVAFGGFDAIGMSFVDANVEYEIYHNAVFGHMVAGYERNGAVTLADVTAQNNLAYNPGATVGDYSGFAGAGTFSKCASADASGSEAGLRNLDKDDIQTVNHVMEALGRHITDYSPTDAAAVLKDCDDLRALYATRPELQFDIDGYDREAAHLATTAMIGPAELLSIGAGGGGGGLLVHPGMSGGMRG